jgi:hypothetical protein
MNAWRWQFLLICTEFGHLTVRLEVSPAKHAGFTLVLAAP